MEPLQIPLQNENPSSRFRGRSGSEGPLLQPRRMRTTSDHQHKLYGDIVNAIMLSIGTVFLAYKMVSERSIHHESENLDAIWVVSAVGFSAICQGLAWKCDSLAFSRLGFVGNCCAGFLMETKEWPFKGICAMNQMSQGNVPTLCLANISMSVREKVVRLIIMFSLISYVSITSPYSVYMEDTLPHLGGTVLAAFMGLYVFHNSPSISNNFEGNRDTDPPTGIFNIRIHIRKDEFVVQLARLMLAAIYVYHTYKICEDVIVYKATTEQFLEGLFGLTKATILAGVGSVATGVFKSNIDQKEQLEVMVRERTKEIHLKNIELRRINIAFEACETAIAITDASRKLIWTNQAFEALAKKTRQNRCSKFKTVGNEDSNACDDSDASTVISSIGRQLTDSIVLEGNTNESKLRGAFDFASPRQDEIEIHENNEGKESIKRQYRVEVTPFSDCDDVDYIPSSDDDSINSTSSDPMGTFQANSHKLFLVAFNNITANRAREQAEQNAREEALLSKAMKESMVTLTHELRTPLQGIMGITSLMLEQQDYERNTKQLTGSSVGKDNFESLGLIMASSSLLLNLINNLLDVKKATANMMDEFLLAPLLASNPIRDAIDFCNPLASISDVNIVMNCFGDTAEAFVNANALRLQQVLINMISNAIKYTDHGTTISVSTRPSTVGETMVTLRRAIASCSDWEEPASLIVTEKNPVLIFSVSDSGPGIEMGQARRLFHRFARLNQQPTRTLGSNTVGQPSGTGLGLHLCQMFIQRMQGWIWVENNASRGSTFSFCLPLVKSPDSSRKNQSSSFVSQSIGPGLESPPSPVRKKESLQGGRCSSPTNYRKLRVLVVDDTLINRKVLDRMLKKIGVTEVSTVESGRDALNELFSSGKTYDLVITDLQMPGMSGTELTEEIFRKQEASEGLLTPMQPLVVVGLTADMSPDVAEKCATCGMSDLLYKPITLVEIKDYFQTKIGKLCPGRWYRHESQ